MLDPWITVWVCTLISLGALVLDGFFASRKPKPERTSTELAKRRQKAMVFEDLEGKQS